MSNISFNPQFYFLFQVYFSAACCILSFYNISHMVSCSLMKVQICPVKHSYQSLETEFPEHSPSFPPIPFQSFTDSYPQRHLKTIKDIAGFYQLNGILGFD